MSEEEKTEQDGQISAQEEDNAPVSDIDENADTPEEEPVLKGEALPLSVRRARAILRGDDPDALLAQTDEIDLSTIFPMSTAEYQDQVAAESKRRADEEAERAAALEQMTEEMKQQAIQEAWEKQKTKEAHKIGQMVYGKGVFAGLHELKDDEGKALGWYNVYTAPEDLPKFRNGFAQSTPFVKRMRLRATFNQAAKTVAKLKDFHEFDGGDYPTSASIHAALAIEGAYNGEWFIPTLDILKNVLHARKSSYYSHGFSNKDDPIESAYWSVTPHNVNGLEKDERATMSFHSTDDNIVYRQQKGPHQLLTRLVRVEKAELKEEPDMSAALNNVQPRLI